VSSIESLEKGFAEFSKDFEGQLDICVPCAGINKNVSFLDTSFQEHQKLIGVNVMGVYHTAQLAAKQMIANGTKKGSIVLVASIASFMAIRSQMSSAYCGTKGVVRAMCPAIAAELNKYVSRNAASRNEIILTTYVGNQSKFHISGPCENRNDVSRKWILS
jgi:short-subunit dehydrogenase